MADYNTAWLGYAALLLLLAASFSSREAVLRVGICCLALIGLVESFWFYDRIGFGLLLLLILAVNLFQISRTGFQNNNVRFSDEEQQLRDSHFSNLSASDARRLIDQGYWISARRGEILIRENHAAPSLFYLADGTATVRRDDADVGNVSGGDLIGEATVMNGTEATGTVLLATNARLWFIPAQALRSYLSANPNIAAGLHEGFARALRGKLANANTRIAKNDPPT